MPRIFGMLIARFRYNYIHLCPRYFKKIANPLDSEALLTESKSKTWLVYARKPFCGAGTGS